MLYWSLITAGNILAWTERRGISLRVRCWKLSVQAVKPLGPCPFPCCAGKISNGEIWEQKDSLEIQDRPFLFADGKTEAQGYIARTTSQVLWFPKGRHFAVDHPTSHSLLIRSSWWPWNCKRFWGTFWVIKEKHHLSLELLVCYE